MLIDMDMTLYIHEEWRVSLFKMIPKLQKDHTKLLKIIHALKYISNNVKRLTSKRHMEITLTQTKLRV